MKYDSMDDYFYFILGFSYAAGRVGWTGTSGTGEFTGDTTKGLSVSQSSDGDVVSITVGTEVQ